jgi:hypothetical protein
MDEKISSFNVACMVIKGNFRRGTHNGSERRAIPLHCLILKLNITYPSGHARGIMRAGLQAGFSRIFKKIDSHEVTPFNDIKNIKSHKGNMLKFNQELCMVFLF